MTTFGLADRGAFAGSTLTFLNRCRSRGIAVGESQDGFTIAAALSDAAVRFGLSPVAEPTAEARSHPPMQASAPRIAIYAGNAIGYPYWGYYAHALLSLGFGFHPVTGEDVAAGDLGEYDLLVMPGGFATWGLDRAEGIDGIDAAISRFIRNGGSYMGSCGGAFYMSQGRPGWHGAIDAMPKFTQEYLMTGAALLGISVKGGVIGRGLPELLELPYYHGPVYAQANREAEELGHFRSHISESGLFIENPLSQACFDREMRGTPAIFMAHFGKGRVVTFSPHPEMGEFVRKGIALEGYVRRYLPIRGFKVMDQTLRFFMKEDCAGFRLIHNAIAALGLYERDVPATQRETVHADSLDPILEQLGRTIADQFAAIEQMAQGETEAMRELVAEETSRLKAEWEDVSARLKSAVTTTPIDSRVATGLSAVLATAARAEQNARLAEILVMTELPIRLVAAALRIIECDRALETPK